MKESLIKALLVDFFDGKTTSLQRKLIEEWLTEDKNLELFYQYLDEWESKHPQFAPDHEQVVSTFQRLVKGQPTSSLPEEKPELNRPFRIGSRYWSAAAVLVCFLGSLMFRKQILYQTLESAVGKPVSYTLSEGTQVVLNSNSTLTVPRFGFGRRSREVWLDGEAEFKVTHTPNNDRFMVRMGNNYQIEVLGTEFVAFSRARGKRVFLKNGKVKLQLPEGRQLYLKPGNLFVSDKNGSFNLTAPTDPRPYTAWKQQTFYFNNTTMADVALQIQEHFNVRVRITDTVLASKPIAGIYKADKVDDLLQTLSELLQIEIVQKEDCIELSTIKLP